MLYTVARLLRGQAIALLALFVALSGGAYAAKVAAKNSVTSKSIRNGAVQTVDLKDKAVTGAKVADDTLTGADISESTLGQVPSASSAQSAATAASAQFGGLAWEAPRGVCTPPSTTEYADCTSVTITLPTAGQVMLTGSFALTHRSDDQYEAAALCAYSVAGTVVGAPERFGKPAGTMRTSYRHYYPLEQLVDAPAGTSTIKLVCKDSYYSRIDDATFIALAVATPVS
ncbi:MAG: hypothetical protein QM572_07180 [Nocardioides sp.]|uniref:hypothetical protein n=1 Tax=Nocardioides sp. TaxID=35761 RepID=UPI0039E482AA